MLSTQNIEVKRELISLQEDFTRLQADNERLKRDVKARDELIA